MKTFTSMKAAKAMTFFFFALLGLEAQGRIGPYVQFSGGSANLLGEDETSINYESGAAINFGVGFGFPFIAVEVFYANFEADATFKETSSLPNLKFNRKATAAGLGARTNFSFFNILFGFANYNVEQEFTGSTTQINTIANSFIPSESFDYSSTGYYFGFVVQIPIASFDIYAGYTAHVWDELVFQNGQKVEDSAGFSEALIGLRYRI